MDNFEQIEQVGIVFHGGDKFISLFDNATALFTIKNMNTLDASSNAFVTTMNTNNKYFKADGSLNMDTQKYAQYQLEAFLISLRGMLNLMNKNKNKVSLDLISSKIVDEENDTEILHDISKRTKFNIRASTKTLGYISKHEKNWKLDYLAYDDDNCHRHHHHEYKIRLIGEYFTEKVRHYRKILTKI